MIDLHYSPTPNGNKIIIALEELELDYNICWVNIGKGDQFKPEFLRISPNNRIPAIVDHDPVDGGEPISIFESGAILVYLAEKTGKFMPQDIRGRKTVLEWLFWQVGGLGPMAGQNHHFVGYAPEKILYAMDRYVKETNRLYGVLNRRVRETGAFLAGADYTIADMATYPWVVPWQRQLQNIDEFPDLKRWLEAIAKRPATLRGYEKGQSNSMRSTLSEEARKTLFGQTAQSLESNT
jgi:GST-like protein